MNTRDDSDEPYERDIEAICVVILDYLRRHPQAQDTVEGITYSWIMEEEIRLRVALVTAALGLLVKRKQVEVLHPSDGPVSYGLKRGAPGPDN